MKNIEEDEILWMEKEGVEKRMEKVYEKVRMVREKIKEEKKMIGLCGDKWKVEKYMIEGNGKKDKEKESILEYSLKEDFEKIIKDIEDVYEEYMIEKIGDGEDEVKILD